MINKLLKPLGYKIVKAFSWMSRGWTSLLIGSFGNAAKENVNNDTALKVSTVYSAIRNISEDIAKLPLKVYRKEGDSRYEVPEHRLYRLLQYQPNPDMTAISFRESQTAQMIGWGNAFSEITRDTDGSVTGLFPLRPDKVVLERDNMGTLYRITTEDGQHYYLPPERVLHTHGLGFDGLLGYNIIQYMAESIGAAIGMDKFSSSFFGNGLHQSGNLEHPSNLSQPAQERLASQLEKRHAGAGNAHRILVLEEGMKFTSNSIDPEAAQMIETRQFTVSEFCRWLRIPPHKVADLSRATFANIEQQNIDYVTDSLTAWAERWEQEIWRKLFTDEEKQQGYYVEHNFDALLRGDIQTRYTAYSQLWDRGTLSINEIRAKENMNPIDGGDKHYVPLNYTTIEDGGLSESVQEDVSERIVNNQMVSIKSAIDKHGKDFDLNKYIEQYQTKQKKYIQSVISPYMRIK